MRSALERLLARAVSFLEGSGHEYMVIGGFALPSFGPMRTTVNLDVAVKVDSVSEFESFVARAAEAEFEPSAASFSNSVCVFVDKKTSLEIEFWLRPDGIVWDRETLRRRRKVNIGDVMAWVVSPEDFIVSKLARPDRGVQDEKDVAGVLVRLGNRLDYHYLNRRARRAGVLSVLEAITRTASKE